MLQLVTEVRNVEKNAQILKRIEKTRSDDEKPDFFKEKEQRRRRDAPFGPRDRGAAAPVSFQVRSVYLRACSLSTYV